MSEHCLRPSDLRSLIGSAQPHRSHQTDTDAVRSAIAANAEWRAAVTDYWSHRQEAIRLSSHVQLMIARGWPRDEAIAGAFEAYRSRVTAQFDDDHLLWLLREGLRLNTAV